MAKKAAPKAAQGEAATHPAAKAVRGKATPAPAAKAPTKATDTASVARPKPAKERKQNNFPIC